MKDIIICTLCPNGCEINIEYTEIKDAQVTGNLCDRGTDYAISECFDPQRTFTGNVNLTGSHRKRLPVRSNKSIPKDKMIACAELLKNITLEAPVESGYTVLKNVFDSGADIVAAMSIRRDK
jgi:CxxC motif-containing protein